jgi:CRP-like cAMP-binding protein
MSVSMKQPDENAAQSNSPNRLLAVLDAEDLAYLSKDMEVKHYKSGTILIEPFARFDHVYFPHSCVVSLVNTVAGGSTVEVGTVGNEGMAGLAVFLDSDAITSRTLVQVPGEMARVPADRFRALAETSTSFRKLLNRYTLAFLAQVSQTATCNRAHTIDERCARWLLMTHDRVNSDAFNLTHEFLAFMLGVRRAGVTVAAGILQKAGLITYKRGNITILNRNGLEEASCDCYAIVRKEFDRLLNIEPTIRIA